MGKRKFLQLAVVGLAVLVAGCELIEDVYEPMGTEGLYTLALYQNEMQVDVVAWLNSYTWATIDNDQKTQALPDELFFWIVPIFENNYESVHTAYPIARKRMDSKDFYEEEGAVTIQIDLASLAEDWTYDWISESDFDGDSEYNRELVDLYIIVADGYYNTYTYDNHLDTSDGGDILVNFAISVPFGIGYSNATALEFALPSE